MSDEQVEELAITVGTTIPATTTIDAIMTSLFATRTADLVGTPTYMWISPYQLAATFPTATTPQGQCVQLLARFEAHSIIPSTAGP